MKSCIVKYILMVSLILMVHVQPVSAHGVIYETKTIGENKIRITLKWSNPGEAKGIIISSFSLRNGKTLKISYEIKEGASTSAYLDYDLKSAVPPIRVVLSRAGDIEWTPFTDIKGIEAEEYIRHLHDAGIVNGRPDGTFRPDDSLTRAEFVIMMVKALGIEGEAPAATGFTDISTNPARKYILLATKHGLISGYPDKTFRPDETITVAQVCTIISKSFTFKTAKNGIYTRLKRDKWYSGYVKGMFDTGILTVNDSIYKNFNEESSIKRADAAMIISRALSTY